MSITLGLEGQELEDAGTQFDAWCSEGDEEAPEETPEDVEVDLGPDVDCSVLGFAMGTISEKCCATLNDYVTSLFAAIAGVDGGSGSLSAEAGWSTIVNATGSDPVTCGECLPDMTPRLDYLFLASGILGNMPSSSYSGYNPEVDGDGYNLLPLWCGFANPRELTPVGNCDQKLIDMVQDYTIGGFSMVSTAGDWWPTFEGAFGCNPSTGTPVESLMKEQIAYIMGVYSTW
jgi:hypothetical protein